MKRCALLDGLATRLPLHFQLRRNILVLQAKNLEGHINIYLYQFFFQHISKFIHGCFSCLPTDIVFRKERMIGLFSTFYFQCRVCNKTEIFQSQITQPNAHVIPINMNIKEGITQTGNGYAQLNEICASVNIPCMSVHRPNVTIILCQVQAVQNMEHNSNLYWCAKFLLLCLCSSDKQKNRYTVPHMFQNWIGSPTEMETDAILEGFLNIISMNGLKQYIKMDYREKKQDHSITVW